MKKVTVGTTTFDLEHDPDQGSGKLYNGLLWKTTLAVGSGTNLVDARQYNGFGEVKSYAATQGSSTRFAATYDDGTSTGRRDGLGRIKKLTEQVDTGSAITTKYEYDSAGRLWKVKDASDVVMEEYTYNGNGNRLAATNTRVTAAQATNAATCASRLARAYRR